MIKIGQPLTLELKNNEDIERYRCKVVELDGDSLYIDYPINEDTGRTGIFSKGTEFSASFVKKDKSVYRFLTEIKGKKQANIPMLIVHYPENELIRIQRREYVRVSSALDISIHDSEGTIAPFTTVSNDISGGGLSVLIPDEYNFTSGKLLNIWVVLPMESGAFEYVYSSSEVIRNYSENNSNKKLLSLKFLEIKDKDRQAVVRYCFETQLRARRRGLT